MSNWKNRTCETCIFRVTHHDCEECRRFPPTNQNGFDSQYPLINEQIRYDEGFTPACAEYQAVTEN